MLKKHALLFSLLVVAAFTFGFAFSMASTAHATQVCCYLYHCDLTGEDILGHQVLGECIADGTVPSCDLKYWCPWP